MLYPRIFLQLPDSFFSTSKVSEFVGIFCRDWVPHGTARPHLGHHRPSSCRLSLIKEDKARHGKTSALPWEDRCDH